MDEVPGPVKIQPLIVALAALTLAGCGPKSSSAGGGAREVDITASDPTNAMKFDVTAIEATPGEPLRVVLTNAGTLPLEVMGHNWVLLKAGADVAAFDAAAIQSKATGYIPASLQYQILAHIDLVGPGKSAQVQFNAPSQPGEYPFLCTFPAHLQAGMKGILTVK